MVEESLRVSRRYQRGSRCWAQRIALSFDCGVSAQVRIPLYGCDCYAYGLLASGLCDLVVEADLKPYDYMALVPIITGAGGVITDWKVCTGRQLLPRSRRPHRENMTSRATPQAWHKHWLGACRVDSLLGAKLLHWRPVWMRCQVLASAFGESVGMRPAMCGRPIG